MNSLDGSLGSHLTSGLKLASRNCSIGAWTTPIFHASECSSPSTWLAIQALTQRAANSMTCTFVGAFGVFLQVGFPSTYVSFPFRMSLHTCAGISTAAFRSPVRFSLYEYGIVFR